MWHSLFALTLYLLSLNTFAVGGIKSDSDDPNYASGASQETFEDLRVKVLGGHIRITRTFTEDGWVWNRRWDSLRGADNKYLYDREASSESNLGPGSFTSESGSSSDYSGIATDNLERYLIRIDQAFRRSGSSSLWESQLRFRISGHDEGYTWSDRLGNKIHYGKDGRMSAYSDQNGVKASVTRNSRGDIATIKDHHGNVVVTYHWELVPGSDTATDDEGQLVGPSYRMDKVIDYTGRTVDYQYDADNQLVGVVDVLGKTWQYTYGGVNRLATQVDPDGRTTTYTFDGHQRLTSRFNNDGVGARYSHNFNGGSDTYYSSVTDGSGTVTERWFDQQGTEVRRDINGETQFTATFILSNNSSDVEDLIKLYKPETSASSSGGFNRDALLGESQEIIYVKSQTRTDARGNKTQTTYDQFKNPIKIIHSNNTTRDTTWHSSFSRPTKVVDERNVVMEYGYDSKGNLTSFKKAVGTEAERLTTHQYDSHGQRTQTTYHGDANTQTAIWQWQYDNKGNVTTTAYIRPT